MNAMEKLRSLFANSLGDAAHLALVKATVPFFDDPATFTANMRFWSTELPKNFEPLIEEGQLDGSIPTEYPREVAQLLALLCNYWLMPCFVPRHAHASCGIVCNASPPCSTRCTRRSSTSISSISPRTA